MAKLSLPLLLLVHVIYFTTSFSCPQHQKEALLHFKASLFNVTSSFPSDKEDLLSQFESWNSGSDCCDWDRVNCDYQFGSRNVIALNLRGFWTLELVASTILTPLFHIRSLTHLDLAWSRTRGELPGDGIAN
nr:receptor-like protein 12 [Quercus suber]